MSRGSRRSFPTHYPLLPTRYFARPTNLPLYRSIFSFLILLLPALGFSQSSPTLSTTGQEVVVTGARYARAAVKSPQRVTVIDSARIARSADLAQLLNEQAGIVINGAYSNPGKDKSVFLRNGANQFTLILLDGQPLVDPSSLGGAVDLRLLSLDGIERIEILRGARSVLYGSDAVAGVINLVSRKGGGTSPEEGAKPDPFRLVLRAAGGSYASLEGGVAVSGSTRQLDYRAGYDHFTTDGLSEARPPEGAPDTTSSPKTGPRVAIWTSPSPGGPPRSLPCAPSLRRASFDGDYDAGSFQDGDNQYANDLLSTSLAADYVRDKWALGLRATYAKTDREFTTPFFAFGFRGRAHQEDVYGIFRPSERTTLTLGTQLRGETLKQGDPDLEDLAATTVSPYLQLNLALSEKLLLEAGYRYNHHSNFGGQSNWSLALGVNSTETWSSRLSLGSAFQSPTLDQLGGPFGANPDLRPQTSLSLELNTPVGGPYGGLPRRADGFPTGDQRADHLRPER